jgi:hypothetical protein
MVARADLEPWHIRHLDGAFFLTFTSATLAVHGICRRGQLSLPVKDFGQRWRNSVAISPVPGRSAQIYRGSLYAVVDFPRDRQNDISEAAGLCEGLAGACSDEEPVFQDNL